MYRVTTASKFRNVRQTYNGYSYQSKLEAGQAQELDLAVRAGTIAGWERQFKVRIEINGFHICDHFVDFRQKNLDGTYTLIECKGMETDVWRIKRKLLEAVFLRENPDHDYRVVKYPSYAKPRKFFRRK